MKNKNRILIVIIVILLFCIYFVCMYFLDKTENHFIFKEKKQDIKNQNLDAEEKGIVCNITPNQKINSPLLIKGQARGMWFFEGSFPIKLLDQNYQEIITITAKAQSDWMTQDFVSFESILEFEKAKTQRGFIVFQKDNPSGLPENDEKIYIPIIFN
ncbi:MAG: Gmad2 immunoglobulin-like domain-containing protein [Patescibacteria group bacterium]|nr:Gmad2 immunoglobulin-like domain-containing protein [Patescibacteria group bacterium]